MVTRIRSVNPVQFGLIYGIILAIFGLLYGLIWVPIMSAMPSSSGVPRWAGAGLGIMFAVLIPAMFFVLGFIGGLIQMAIYNLVAGWTGGVEVTLVNPPVEAPVPPSATGYTA